MPVAESSAPITMAMIHVIKILTAQLCKEQWYVMHIFYNPKYSNNVYSNNKLNRGSVLSILVANNYTNAN